MTEKHWTEPNGIFIINIPVNWQYKNAVFEHIEEKSPYSFEQYENSTGCFQLSCYPLSERGVNPNFPIQKSDSKINWLESRMDDEEFDMYLWHAQVDDQFCMAKCIYSAKDRKTSKVKKLVKKSRKALESLRVVPVDDRSYAIALNKYDNFNGSLASSYDLRERALESKSHIEIIAIVSNQIDAYLRISIVLKKQLEEKTNNIQIKYLFQEENERGIMERTIYKEAKSLNIISEEIFNELNLLYDMRNRVIHRYIISYIKTIDIAESAVSYLFLCEKIREILKSIEEEQIDNEIGIYGKGYLKNYEVTLEDQRIAWSMANDKHLLKYLQRKIE
ncbi:hypothetical protein H0I29_00630 [Polaribacter sp. R2A056_3_33]|uniref:hypothetical protein n=1 Tax=Polaribacter sp. R2A056_3_33 TaxID=2745563 RepID=UPI001C4E872F|nr:hypothetical protein [Polaribacter sp. R2A056_3_33]QXP70647.1 hypothetical protein H0I29_00630 [Polaribacter sp. R2A056_3_33]